MQAGALHRLRIRSGSPCGPIPAAVWKPALAGAKAAVGTRRGLNCRMEKAVFVRLHLDRGRRTNGNATATAGADIRNLRDVHKVSLKVSIAVLIFLIQRSGKTI